MLSAGLWRCGREVSIWRRVEGLTVSAGESTGATEDGGSCGTRAAHELIFEAQSTAILDAGQTSPITLDDGPAQVMNIASWYYDPQTCSDVGRPDVWMAWRAASL